MAAPDPVSVIRPEGRGRSDARHDSGASGLPEVHGNADE